MDITKALLQQLGRGEAAKTIYPIGEVIVRLFFTPQRDHSIVVRGYIEQKSPQMRISGINDVSGKAASLSAVPYVARSICNRLLKAYKKLDGAEKSTVREIKGSFAEQVLAITDIMLPNNYNQYTKRGWGKSTAEQAVKYYAHTFGKFYETYGFDAGAADFAEYLEAEINRIYNTQYQRPCKDGSVIKQRREQIYNGLMTRWMQARIVQQFLTDHHPEYDWPKFLIPISAKYTVIRMEEIKAISYRQYITFRTLLYRLCRAENPYAFAAIGEATCGMRIGESDAPLLGDFEVLDVSVGRYYVDWQIDGAGKRTQDLKNDPSHRYVFFGADVCEFIDMRMSQLVARGVTTEELELMPLASTATEPYEFMPKNKVASFIRSLLVLSGCDDKWLSEQAEKMFIAAKIAGNEEDLHIGAHLLRRFLATSWANGGMSDRHVNAILGHEDKTNKRIDYASDEMARQIVNEMQRSIYLGSLAKLHGPAWDTQIIDGDASYHMNGNMSYHFKVEEDMYVDISVLALEPGEEIQIIMPDVCSTNAFLCRSKKDTLESRQNRPILAKLPDAEEVERWIDDAMKINLDSIMEKYK